MDENGNTLDVDEMTGEILDSNVILSHTSVSMPQFKDVSTSRYYDIDTIVDYADLEKLNAATRAARIALFNVTEDTNRFDRAYHRAKVEYERAYRREFLNSNEKTDAAKRMRADLKCEELENNVVVMEQARGELNRLSNSIRLELQTLQALGNNLRQQIKGLQ